jgi:hypothetical protein
LKNQIVKQQKEKGLSLKQINMLDSLIKFNFKKLAAFNDLYSGSTITDQSKIQQFNKLFAPAIKNQSYQYIDNFYKTRFKEAFLSKEKVLYEILDTIELARQSKDYRTALQGYKILTDLMGMNITKGEIEVKHSGLVVQVLDNKTPLLIDKAIDMIKDVEFTEVKKEDDFEIPD